MPPAQRRLWRELATVPRSFILYGGTALALRLGHRVSVDFDFFSSDALDPTALRTALPFLGDAQLLDEKPGALTVSVDRGGPVKVSFFGPINFGRIGSPDATADGALRVASLLDLAGTKIKALLQRVESKDYLDIAALLRAGVPLEEILGSAMTLFGPAFNPVVARKTLAWFEGGDLDTLDASTRDLLTRAALRDTVLTPLPRSSARLD